MSAYCNLLRFIKGAVTFKGKIFQMNSGIGFSWCVDSITGIHEMTYGSLNSAHVFVSFLPHDDGIEYIDIAVSVPPDGEDLALGFVETPSFDKDGNIASIETAPLPSKTVKHSGILDIAASTNASSFLEHAVLDLEGASLYPHTICFHYPIGKILIAGAPPTATDKTRERNNLSL